MHTTLIGVLLLTATASSAQQAPRVASSASSVNGKSAVAVATPPPAPSVPDAALGGTVYHYESDVVVNGKTLNAADLKSKEVSKEIAVPKGAEIYIEGSSSRSIVVKTWDQQKVKVSTTVYYDGESSLNDEAWLEKLNVSLKTLGSSVKIKSGGVTASGVAYSLSGTSRVTTSGSGVAVFNSQGKNIGTDPSLRRVLTITVPSGSNLDIESKYGDIQLPAGINEAAIDITNGNLEADNLKRLKLRSKYSNANVGNIEIAELEFANGRFTAKDVAELDVDSKYSTIEMASAKKASIRSTNDEYEIEEAGDVTGRKNYGNLRITKLNSSLELDGSNADVKVRRIGPALNTIKIDNRYADIRIPLKEVKNYQVSFTGTYSSVYGNFEKVPVTEVTEVTSGTKTTAPQRERVAQYTSAGFNSGPTSFTAKVGDGNGLKVDMKCQNCTVDFK